MMAERVRFEKPPVVEVVCGVLFGTLVGLRTAHVGVYWNRIRQEFPLVDEAPPLSAIIETVDPVPSIEIEVGMVPPLARSWFHRADRRGLIQLQRDRFVYNWKRSSPTDGAYPSYDQVIIEFERQWEQFRDFVAGEQLGDLVPRQLELAYVNIIPDTSVPAGDPVFKDHARNDSPGRFLPPAESLTWRTSYPFPDNAGRLHVVISSARQADTGDPIKRLDMVARGINEISATQMRAWFDLAHDWIVRGFVDVTTSSMQAEWRRQS
jgi:uncharacterized protein (TIGR04255 family)